MVRLPREPDKTAAKRHAPILGEVLTNNLQADAEHIAAANVRIASTKRNVMHDGERIQRAAQALERSREMPAKRARD